MAKRLRPAEEVVSEEQLAIWADEAAYRIRHWVEDFETYDDKVAFIEHLKAALRDVATSALDQHLDDG